MQTSPVLTNLEANHAFDVHWAWEEARTRRGITAVLRVKDEARALPFVLPHLLEAVRHVVLVDNGSTDGTREVAAQLAADSNATDRLEIHTYPFSVSRCGPEHLDTPMTSLRSLTYFYNWSFSHVRTAYALKWDGDMVLTGAGVGALRDLGWQLEAVDAVVRIPRYPLYVLDDRVAFLDTGLRNIEPWGWPNKPGYIFVKAFEWELPLRPPKRVGEITLPEWSAIELKHLDVDEFAHWSHTDFTRTGRQQRKQREWAVYHALYDGAELPEGVRRIEAPDGVNVVDHVRNQPGETWGVVPPG